jgi:hypothetical protein
MDRCSVCFDSDCSIDRDHGSPHDSLVGGSDWFEDAMAMHGLNSFQYEQFPIYDDLDGVVIPHESRTFEMLPEPDYGHGQFMVFPSGFGRCLVRSSTWEDIALTDGQVMNKTPQWYSESAALSHLLSLLLISSKLIGRSAMAKRSSPSIWYAPRVRRQRRRLPAGFSILDCLLILAFGTILSKESSWGCWCILSAPTACLQRMSLWQPACPITFTWAECAIEARLLSSVIMASRRRYVCNLSKFGSGVDKAMQPFFVSIACRASNARQGLLGEAMLFQAPIGSSNAQEFAATFAQSLGTHLKRLFPKTRFFLCCAAGRSDGSRDCLLRLPFFFDSVWNNVEEYDLSLAVSRVDSLITSQRKRRTRYTI